MHQVNINPNVFEAITQDRPIKIGRIQKWINYISWSRESEELKKLGNLTFALIIIIVLSIAAGVMQGSIQLMINGIQNFMHLFSYMFSMYALMKAKKNANMHYTYGYTRYETIAAFSNCVFLILSSLFLVMSSLHYLNHDEDHNNKDSTGDQAQQKEHHEEDESGPLVVFYVKIIFNLIGIYSFSEYALFAPLEQFEDIGANTSKYAYSGVNESTYKNFSFKYERFYRYLTNNNQHFVEDAQPKQLNAHPHSSKLQFTSHYENMHSVFLHFFIDFLFNFSTLAGHYLMNLNYSQIALILPIIIMLVTIMFTKKLSIVTFKILLQALPVDDEQGVRQMLKEIQSINGVVDIPQQQFWGMTVGYLVCNLTIRIRKSSSSEEILQSVHSILGKKFYSICVQIEESKQEY